jgi:hypothetical protein
VQKDENCGLVREQRADVFSSLARKNDAKGSRKEDKEEQYGMALLDLKKEYRWWETTRETDWLLGKVQYTPFQGMHRSWPPGPPITNIPRPVVVAENMIGCAMYELV